MGIQSDVNEQLTREANVTSLEEWQKYAVMCSLTVLLCVVSTNYNDIEF